MAAVDGTTGKSRAWPTTSRWRALAALLVALLVAPSAGVAVSAADPVPVASPAVAAAQLAIPGDLWDVNPGVEPGQSYVALESAVGDPVGQGQQLLLTNANAAISVEDGADGLGVFVVGDERWTGHLFPPAADLPLHVGYYPGADQGVDTTVPRIYWSGSSFCSSGPITGWFAIDEITSTAGVLSSVTARFEQSCDGAPPLHGKIRWFASDSTKPPGPRTPIPTDLWDTAPPVMDGVSYVALDGAAGGVIGAGEPVYTKHTSTIGLSSSGRELSVTVSGPATWSGQFGAMSSLDELTEGYYPNIRQNPFNNPATGGLYWAQSPPGCGSSVDWFAIDHLERTAGSISQLTLRFGQSCNGGPEEHGKIQWFATDPQTPTPVTPIPDGLWDASPPNGTTGDYVVVQGASGDQVTGGADLVVVGSAVGAGFQPPPLGGGDDELGVLASQGSGSTARAISVQVRGPGGTKIVGSGYHPNVSASLTDPTDSLLDVRYFDPSGHACAGAISGWFAVDRIEVVDGTIYGLDLRLEQSCMGAPPLHVKVHVDRVPPPTTTTTTTAPPTTTTTVEPTTTTTTPLAPSLPPGPPIGSLDAVVPIPGGLTAAGWAIDPDTVDPANVNVVVDGTHAIVSADRFRPDVGAAFVGYGPAHGFSASFAAAPGLHRVCAYGVNVGVGADSLLGCRSVTVPSGPPIGNIDQFVAGPGPVNLRLAGWAIDPDTAAPATVRVYIDGASLDLTASESRPDVGAAHPGYGPDHGFSATLTMTPGSHRVCVYALNLGLGSNSLIGCRDVVVPTGPPFGSLDIVTAGPGSVRVAGWAIDPDTYGSIPVHLYVDGASVALTANMTRPDVGSAFPAYGAGHGYDATVRVPPGTHHVCTYGINVVGVGTNTQLGCRTVTVS